MCANPGGGFFSGHESFGRFAQCVGMIYMHYAAKPDLASGPTRRMNATERLLTEFQNGGLDLNCGSSERETNCVNSR
jgi:hypothetical protein